MQTEKKFSARAHHACAEYVEKLAGVTFVARSNGTTWYATAENSAYDFGCGKDRRTPELAVEYLLRNEGYFRIALTEQVEARPSTNKIEKGLRVWFHEPYGDYPNLPVPVNTVGVVTSVTDDLILVRLLGDSEEVEAVRRQFDGDEYHGCVAISDPDTDHHYSTPEHFWSVVTLMEV